MSIVGQSTISGVITAVHGNMYDVSIQWPVDPARVFRLVPSAHFGHTYYPGQSVVMGFLNNNCDLPVIITPGQRKQKAFATEPFPPDIRILFPFRYPFGNMGRTNNIPSEAFLMGEGEAYYTFDENQRPGMFDGQYIYGLRQIYELDREGNITFIRDIPDELRLPPTGFPTVFDSVRGIMDGKRLVATRTTTQNCIWVDDYFNDTRTVKVVDSNNQLYNGIWGHEIAYNTVDDDKFYLYNWDDLEEPFEELELMETDGTYQDKRVMLYKTEDTIGDVNPPGVGVITGYTKSKADEYYTNYLRVTGKDNSGSAQTEDIYFTAYYFKQWFMGFNFRGEMTWSSVDNIELRNLYGSVDAEYNIICFIEYYPDPFLIETYDLAVIKAGASGIAKIENNSSFDVFCRIRDPYTEDEGGEPLPRYRRQFYSPMILGGEYEQIHFWDDNYANLFAINPAGCWGNMQRYSVLQSDYTTGLSITHPPDISTFETNTPIIGVTWYANNGVYNFGIKLGSCDFEEGKLVYVIGDYVNNLIFEQEITLPVTGDIDFYNYEQEGGSILITGGTDSYLRDGKFYSVSYESNIIYIMYRKKDAGELGLGIIGIDPDENEIIFHYHKDVESFPAFNKLYIYGAYASINTDEGWVMIKGSE